MEKNVNHIDAYILAGGKSSRMGTDKGLLLMEGELLIERIIKQLNTVFEKIIIVSNNPEYNKFGCEVIQDRIKDIGPAGGIHAALNHVQSNYAFIISCDMPFITPEAIQYIVNHSLGSQITMPVHHKKMQPLFGVYAKDCLPVWESLIEQKIIKLQEMVTHFKLNLINTEGAEFFNDVTFMNINDKKGLENAVQQLKYGH